MRIDILTLFPEAVRPMMDASILGRAAKKGLIEINCIQIRDFTDNRQDFRGWAIITQPQPPP